MHLKNEYVVDSATGFKVKRNRYGYYQLDPIPSEQELSEYYAQKYYQNSKGSYSSSYTDEEKEFFRNRFFEKELLINKYLRHTVNTGGGKKYLLDIGCGEGFLLDYFDKRGFDVLGIDYSDFGIKQHNPRVIDKLIKGNLIDVCDTLIGDGKKFDVVNLDNVLEHVISPEAVLKRAHALLRPNGMLIIAVPNDFNPLQMFLFDNGMIHRKTWLAVPDHISYFNRDGLVALCNSLSFSEDIILGKWLTEFFALNKNTNYYDNPACGHDCHLARVAMEKMFYEISPEKTIKLEQALIDMGLGRLLIGVFHKV